MEQRIFSLLIFFVISTVNIFANPIGQPVSNFIKANEPGEYRLPKDTIPINYDIHLITNIHEGDFDFTGTVKITLKVLEETDTITIHSRQLEIENDYELLDKDENPFPVTLEYVSKTEFLKFKLEQVEGEEPKKLKKGEYTLEINYNGTLRDDNGGFYRSSYTNEAGKEV